MYKDRLGFQCRDEADDLRDRVVLLERALLVKAKRDHLPCDVITPERRVERWIEDARESMKTVQAEETGR